MVPSFRFYHPHREELKITPTIEGFELKAHPATYSCEWTLPNSLHSKQLRCIGLQVVPADSDLCSSDDIMAADSFDLAAMLESMASEWALCRYCVPLLDDRHTFETMALIPVSGLKPRLVQALPDIALLAKLRLATSDPCWSSVVTFKAQQIKAKLIEACNGLPNGIPVVGGRAQQHLLVTVVVIQESLPLLKKAFLVPAGAAPAGTADLAAKVVSDLEAALGNANSLLERLRLSNHC